MRFTICTSPRDLVMEFIPGETLQQKLDRCGPLDGLEMKWQQDFSIGKIDSLAGPHGRS